MPGAGPRNERHDRPHAAQAHRGPRSGRPARTRARRRPRRADRLPGALHGGSLPRHPRQAHDRRHPARRNPVRPGACPVRHDHHRRSPRALPQHRLPAGIPGPPPAAAARPQGDHHLRHDRHAALRRAFQRTRRRSLRAHVPRRNPLPSACRGRRRRSDRPSNRDRRGLRGAHGRGARRHPRLPLGRGRDSRRAGRLRRRARTQAHRAGRAVLGSRRRRGAPPVFAPVGGRAASHFRTAPPSPHHPRHEYRRDLADRSGHPLRRRPGNRSNLALFHANQGAAPSDRADLAGEREPARGPQRTRGGRHLHPAVFAGGLRRAREVHAA